MSIQTPEILFPPLPSQVTLPSHASISQWGQELQSPHLYKGLWDLPGVPVRAEIPSGSFVSKGEGTLCTLSWGVATWSSGREGEAHVWLVPTAIQDWLVGYEPDSLEGKQSSLALWRLQTCPPCHLHVTTNNSSWLQGSFKSCLLESCPPPCSWHVYYMPR